MSLIIETCVKHWLKIAIDATKDPTKVGRMLTIKEFIHYTHFKVDTFAMDKFYHNLNNDLFIYMDEYIIKWFGYNGTIGKQREKIRDILKNNFKKYENKYWFEYSNEEYGKFYSKKSISLIREMENHIEESNKLYPDPVDFKYKNQTKHMIVHPKIFMHVVLMAGPQNYMIIRDYFIKLEELIKKYSQYQTEAIKNENMSLLQTLKETNNLMIINEKKADEERIKAEQERIKAEQERIKAEQERIKAETRHQESQLKADKRINMLLGFAEEAKVEVMEKIGEIVEITTDLNNVVNDRVSTKRVSKNEHTYVVILKDDSDLEVPYYVLRTQLKSINSRIKELKKNIQHYEKFLEYIIQMLLYRGYPYVINIHRLIMIY